MTHELILAFLAYAFVTSITPGPNNAMLLASGVNFGLKASVPHILGVNIGFAVLILSVGLGLGGVFEALPILHDAMKYVGAAYLIYLAWKIAGSGVSEADRGRRVPLTFMQAAAFQWVNPKAWIMAIGAIATYTQADGFLAKAVLVTILFSIVNAPCIIAWAAVGTALRGVLSKPIWLRVFNVAMALMLVASLYPIFRAR
ncbi:LysE family translocator [Aliirhizobium terrae]|uniref:LysE family translocator n=1 Tax=Terrirhizobium terrae TaxID=2926709 RepID=UPI002576FAA2|nr:LysE family translocator [Rhizobium sp. CC-CFT758]WJH40970.1 LysE family translocator [Rhizobium sp. CC-CFT758]